jgi:hypothetical protein
LIIDDDDIIPNSDSFDNLPPATPVISQQAPTSKRKHSASSTNSQPTSKRLRSDARPSGAVALHGIHDRLDDFTEIFRYAMTDSHVPQLLATPARKSKAMQRAQTLESTLSDEHIVKLMDLFQKDVTMADAYLSIKRHGVRKAWVNQHLPHTPEPAVEADDEADDIYA